MTSIDPIPCSTRSSTTSLDRLPTSHGHCPCTMLFSPSFPLSSSAFSINSSRLASWTGILSSTHWDRRMRSSQKLLSGCGSWALCITVWSVLLKFATLRILIVLFSQGHVWVLNNLVLGRPQAIKWLGFRSLVLGNHPLPYSVAHSSGKGCLGF